MGALCSAAQISFFPIKLLHHHKTAITHAPMNLFFIQKRKKEIEAKKLMDGNLLDLEGVIVIVVVAVISRLVYH